MATTTPQAQLHPPNPSKTAQHLSFDATDSMSYYDQSSSGDHTPMEMESGDTMYVDPVHLAQYTPEELGAAYALIGLHMRSLTSASQQQETASTTETAEATHENSTVKSRNPNKKITLAQYIAWKAAASHDIRHLKRCRMAI